MRGAVATIALLLSFACGCDEANRKAVVPRPRVPPGAGVIAGTVTLAGTAPPMREIPNSACHPGGPQVKEESVVADDAGRLANVVVFLEEGPAVDVTGDPVVLDQSGCRYTPHVVAVRTGQTLRVRSSDATLHNVYGQCRVNPAFNFGMTGAGQAKDLTFDRPETFRVKCDVHPWMSGYVAVFDHPLFAVTGAAGGFEIRNVPPGTYTLVAWHERLGTQKRQVTVPGDATPTHGTQPGQGAQRATQPVTADFTFAAGAGGPKG